MTNLRDYLNDLAQLAAKIQRQVHDGEISQQERDELTQDAIDETLQIIKDRLIG